MPYTNTPPNFCGVWLPIKSMSSINLFMNLYDQPVIILKFYWQKDVYKSVVVLHCTCNDHLKNQKILWRADWFSTGELQKGSFLLAENEMR